MVVSLHLESLKHNSHYRKEQLSQLYASLDENSENILCGDFNFCSTWTEEQKILGNLYQDVWPLLFPQQPHQPTIGTWIFLQFSYNFLNFFLFFSQSLLGVCYPSDQYSPARFDRILAKSQYFIPTYIKLLGNQIITNKNGLDVYPSDHLGLYCEFNKISVT